MSWFSDDVTFCANSKCEDTSCRRNRVNIRHVDIPHSFGLFTQCEKWNDAGAEWLMKQIPDFTELD